MAKKTVEQVIRKEYPEFAGMVDGLSIVELEARIGTYAKENEKVKDALADDEGIKSLADELKTAKAPYGDAKKAINLKIRYLIGLIKERGGDA